MTALATRHAMVRGMRVSNNDSVVTTAWDIPVKVAMITRPGHLLVYNPAEAGGQFIDLAINDVIEVIEGV